MTLAIASAASGSPMLTDVLQASLNTNSNFSCKDEIYTCD